MWCVSKRIDRDTPKGMPRLKNTHLVRRKCSEARDCSRHAASGTRPKAVVTSLQLDFDVHASGQIQLHQGIHGFIRGVHDVHQTLMGADFELVTTGLVDVW